LRRVKILIASIVDARRRGQPRSENHEPLTAAPLGFPVRFYCPTPAPGAIRVNLFIFEPMANLSHNETARFAKIIESAGSPKN
jgi:hypothetical protein